jgi:hypothetical protein
MAKCTACGAVYDLSGRKAHGLEVVPRERPPLRPKPALPEHFRVQENDGSTTLSWRWFHAGHVLTALLSVAWLGIPTALYNHFFKDGAHWLVTLLLLLILAPGVFLVYITLAGFLNTTRVEASRGGLRIQHGPLPWWGNLHRPGRELTQLYGQAEKGQTTYKLLALDREGHEVLLLEHLETEVQTLYLEQALERALGIEDRPVEGELAQRTNAS